MKNFFKVLSIIALAAVIGFGLASCDNGGGGGGGGGGGSGVLSAPVVTAKTISSSVIQVSWKPISGAARYNVYNSLSPSSGFELLIQEPTTSITNFNLPSSTTIYYKVAAVSANGTEGTMSSVASATTLGSGSDNNTATNPDVGTGNQASRTYRAEVYNINSATWTYLSNTYGDKSYHDVVKADVISRGGTVLNSYPNQTFSGVTSILTSACNSIGVTGAPVTNGINRMTEALQTNNRSGHNVWFYSGSTYRYFYVNRTATSSYTVEVYNINSATWTYLSNTYGDKSYQDVIRADVISRGGTVLNSYPNQTFSGVTSIYTSACNSIGLTSANTVTTEGINRLTEALQTNNRSGHNMWFYLGSTYRYFYVTQE